MILRRVVTAGLALLGCAAVALAGLADPAQAQQESASPKPLAEPKFAPANTSSTPEKPGAGATYIPEPHDRYSVLVLGDALAGGLWAGMGRAAKPDDRIQVEVRYREGSGFARADLYDWLEALPGILDRNQVHAAVILLGSNDGQDMRIGDQRLPFGSPEWKAKYQEVVDTFLAELRKRSIAVYWVGLPPMARPDYDQAMQQINELVKARADAVGVKFIDIRKNFTDEMGKYTEMGLDEETRVYRRLRDRDGIRFLKRGNTKLASIVLDVLRQDMKAAENPPPAQAAAPAEQAKAAELTNPLPFFGQPGLKEPILIQPEMPRTNRPVTAALVEKPNVAEALKLDVKDGEDGLTALQKSVSPGSPAAELFFKGIAPQPKPGRTDDFAWTSE